MAQVRRYDRAELRPPVRTDAGFLRADAYLTRTGVFEYRRADGTIRRELRLPEEVFAPRSLDSLQAAPLTLEHPKFAVTPENVGEVGVGAVGTDVRQDGDFVRGTVMVMRADAIAKVDGGEMRELSCGYDCTLDETPGVYRGERYDAIQRGVIYNHLAIVPAGRAGPEVRLHLDAADAEMVHPQTAPKGGRQENPMGMRKVKIGKRRFDVDEQVADSIEEEIAALEKALADKQAELEASKTDNEKLTAEKDTAEEELEKEKEAKADALKKIPELVQARVALEAQARSVLGPEAKLDDKSDLDVMKLVVAKVSPSTKLDDKGEVYVQARYDAAIERVVAEPNKALGNLRVRADATDEGGERTAEARRDAMKTRARDAWKQPLMGGTKESAR